MAGGGYGQTIIKTIMYLMLYNKIITIVSESSVGMGGGGGRYVTHAKLISFFVF